MITNGRSRLYPLVVNTGEWAEREDKHGSI